MKTQRNLSRLSFGAGAGSGSRALPEEVAIALSFNGSTQAVMMATPADLHDFAYGFALTEGIARPEEIQSLEVVETPLGLDVQIWLSDDAEARLAKRRRTMAGPVGCGLCGIDSLEEALRKVEGAFSVVAMTRTKLVGVRDPLGVRPLVLGKVGDGWALASETCALDIIGAEFVREIEPGEMVVINAKDGVASHFPFRPQNSRFCIFEHVYFSRPDSILGGRSVYETRRQIGIELAREAPVEADLVCPVPDSGTPAAIGYAHESGIPYGMGIIRNQYMGRTFIEPTEQIRNMGVRLKLNVNRALIKGKRVILVDDSVVRGTTSRKIKEMILDAGAAEVHFRIASPPTAWPCFYGVDTPQREKLLAATMTEEEMRQHLGVDSLRFISLDGLYRAVGEAKGRNPKKPAYCDACFSGEYPVAPSDKIAEGFEMKAAE